MIGIYGGAFDPFHNGHLEVIKTVLPQVDYMFVAPSFDHPFGKKMAPFNLRYSWVSRSITKAFYNMDSEIKIFVSDAEAEIAASKSGPIYTIDVLEFFEKKYNLKKKDIAYIIGEDNVVNMPKFKDYEKIKEYSLIIIPEQENFKHSSELKRSLSIKGLQNQVESTIINDIILHYQGVPS